VAADEAADSSSPPGDSRAAVISLAPNTELSESPSLDAGPAPDAATPAEEPLIEVWRPRPPARRRPPHHGGPVKENGPARRPIDGAEGHVSDRRGDRGKNRRRGLPTPDDPKIVAEATLETQPTEGSAKFHRGRGARGPSHPSNGRDNAGRRRNANPGGAKEDRAQEDRKREIAPPPPPRREQPVNMNSPFAKLLALKTQLETKGKGG
jgi:ATP-dependent RNA helicase SUPV3L1/SUV3